MYPRDNEDESTWFNDLNENSSFDEIIDKLLLVLSKQKYNFTPFSNCNLFDDVLIIDVIQKLESERLIDIILPHMGYDTIKIKTKGSDIVRNGGWLKLLESQKQEIDNKNYKDLLEIEKLKYERANQELDTKIKKLTKQNLELSNENATLTKTNLTLQNWDIRFRWVIATVTFVAGLLLRVAWLALSRLWQ